MNLIDVYEFCKKAHEGQYRDSGEQYYIHPFRVAELVLEHTDDMDIVYAALCHDILEDTEYTYDDIAQKISPRVANIVVELTNVSKKSDGNRAARKALDRERIKSISSEAKLIKLCDRVDNLRDMKGFSEGFKRLYKEESRLLLDECLRGINKDLEYELELLCR